jgi:hypothetical protein
VLIESRTPLTPRLCDSKMQIVGLIGQVMTFLARST